METEAPVGIRVQMAVCQAELRPALRHVLMVMAALADRRTGIGYASQATLAQATGYTERAIRAMLAELAATQNAPVRVTRRARFRSEGRGRTSDEYRLEVTSTGTGMPVEQPTNRNGDAGWSVDQPEAGDRLTGSWRPTNRKLGAGDPGRDPGRDPGSARVRARPRLELVGEPDGVTELRRRYVSEYQTAIGTEPALSKRAWRRAEAAFVELLAATQSLERAKTCVSRTFADPWRRRRRCQPWDIAADCNALLAEVQAPVTYESAEERRLVRNRLLDEATNGKHGPAARAWSQRGRDLAQLADLLERGLLPEGNHHGIQQARPRSSAAPAELDRSHAEAAPAQCSAVAGGT